jgi:hypothetical protein
MRKVLPWLALILAVLWITNDPAGAAASVREIVADFASFAYGL